MKVKLKKAVSINGGNYFFKKGEVVNADDVPRWVIDLLLDRYAVEVRERKPKTIREV